MSKDILPASLDQQVIDPASAVHPFSLQFPVELEAQFERETSLSRARRLAIGGLIGLVIYDFLVVADWWLTPDILTAAVWFRLGIVTPIELFAIWVLWKGPSFFWREAIIVVLGALVPTATQLLLMLGSASPFRYAQHQTIVLVILFALLVQRIRFVFAVPTCLICVALYALALHQLTGFPFELELAANAVLVSVVVFSLFVAYTLEREARLNYLLDLKGRIQNRLLDQMSHQDSLTGLQNRRSLDERLAALSCTEELMSIIIADVDHFKKFNDAAGHQAGDRCLSSVAARFRAALSVEDATIFRYGGEEFLVLLPGIDFQEARAIAENLRISIEKARIRHPGLPAGSVVTASFGIATGRACGLTDIEQIIGGSDAALYAAKHSGRNQVWPPISKDRHSGTNLPRAAGEIL